MFPVDRSAIERLQTDLDSTEPIACSSVIQVATQVLQEARERKLSQEELLQLDGISKKIVDRFGFSTYRPTFYERNIYPIWHGSEPITVTAGRMANALHNYSLLAKNIDSTFPQEELDELYSAVNWYNDLDLPQVISELGEEFVDKIKDGKFNQKQLRVLGKLHTIADEYIGPGQKWSTEQLAVIDEISKKVKCYSSVMDKFSLNTLSSKNQIRAFDAFETLEKGIGSICAREVFVGIVSSIKELSENEQILLIEAAVNGIKNAENPHEKYKSFLKEWPDLLIRYREIFYLLLSKGLQGGVFLPTLDDINSASMDLYSWTGNLEEEKLILADKIKSQILKEREGISLIQSEKDAQIDTKSIAANFLTWMDPFQRTKLLDFIEETGVSKVSSLENLIEILHLVKPNERSFILEILRKNPEEKKELILEKLKELLVFLKEKEGSFSEKLLGSRFPLTILYLASETPNAFKLLSIVNIFIRTEAASEHLACFLNLLIMTPSQDRVASLRSLHSLLKSSEWDVPLCLYLLEDAVKRKRLYDIPGKTIEELVQEHLLSCQEALRSPFITPREVLKININVRNLSKFHKSTPLISDIIDDSYYLFKKLNKDGIGHGDLIQLIQGVGCKGNKGGVCFGVAQMGIQAMLCGREGVLAFQERLTKISSLLKERSAKDVAASLVETQEEISLSLERIEQEIFRINTAKSLSEEEKKRFIIPIEEEKKAILEKAEEVIDLLAFFQGVDLYFQAYKYAEDRRGLKEGEGLFEKGKGPLGQQTDLLEVIPLVLSQKLEAMGGIDRVVMLKGTYTKIDLFVCFQELKKLFKQDGMPLVAFSLGANGHGVSLGYSKEEDSWLWLDANNLPLAKISDFEIADVIFKGFFADEDPCIKLDIVAYAIKHEAPLAIEQFQDWANKPIIQNMSHGFFTSVFSFLTADY